MGTVTLVQAPELKLDEKGGPGNINPEEQLEVLVGVHVSSYESVVVLHGWYERVRVRDCVSESV